MPEEPGNIIGLHKRTADQAVSFSYRGPFREDFTQVILEIYGGTESARQSEPVVTRKVSFLLVECFQNILRHGENVAGVEPDFRDNGLFGFRTQGDLFTINSINIVPNEEVEVLRNLMESVNSLDTSQLKELYLQQLSASSLSEKGGAGLGLIELARKSGRPVLYQFDPAPGNRSYFHQQVTFCPGPADLSVPGWIEETRKMYEEMAAADLLLCYKGDFSQKAILPLLQIVEQNASVNRQINHIGRKAGHLLIEILQNISRHGCAAETSPVGLFTIGWRDGRIVLQSGNLVDNQERAFLADKLSYLSELSREELVELHKVALKSSLRFESKHKSGLGLIEIARASSVPIEFSFSELQPHRHLFTLQVAI